MSWFVEISEKAENILNTIDKNAAIALNKQKSPKSNKYNHHIPDQEASTVNVDEYHESPVQPDVYVYNEKAPVQITENLENHSYQPTVSNGFEKSSDQFQSEILQNEIHSLNNEISLLLNRAKIAEQNSIHLTEKLAIVERQNRLLEEQLSEYSNTSDYKQEVKPLKSSENSSSNVSMNKSEWHDHYEAQIQELIQDRTNLEETLKTKNDEIMKLKSRLNQQSFTFSSDDLNSRLRALTITLVQKQSSLERLTAEKSSIESKYEQLQKKYEEVVNMLQQRINMNDTDDVKAQIPVFKEGSYSSGIRHRLRNAYTSFTPSVFNIDLLFKKSSSIRAFIWIYLVLLHGLIFLLLSSYMPETTSI